MAIAATRASTPLRSRGAALLWSLSSSMTKVDLDRNGATINSGAPNGNHQAEEKRLIHSGASDHCKVAVVGAGPAGLAVLSTLLDLGQSSILWIDPQFNAGRLSNYTEVPSNTKVKLFQQYVTTSPSLNRYSKQALAPFQDQDPDRGCSLGLAARMVKTLTDSIREEVRSEQALVRELRFLNGKWHLDTGTIVDQVYLATGSAPASHAFQGETIDLDLALKPSSLPSLLSDSDIVGVVGSSHSAMLALRNLVDCTVRPKKIINFYRSPLLYAQYMDDWILYDNTGLKGEVAEWAKKEIDTGNLEKNGIVDRQCVKGLSLDEQMEQWRGCTKLIQAVGFNRNPLPRIVVDGEELVNVEYDPSNGRIAEGLFGYGIAFPERTTDPHGNRELAVGLWKFMRYARASVKNHASHLS